MKILHNLKEEKKEYLMMAIFCAIIFVVQNYNVNSFVGLTIGVDDFGYINNALCFLGKEWKELSSNLSYYSFGYSIFLIPFVALIENPTMLFKAIVEFNILLIILSYVLSIKCAFKFYEKVPRKYIIVLCFVASMYISNFVYSKYVLTEACVGAIFWAIIYLLQKIIEKYSFGIMILLGIISAYMILVHQRTLVIFVALIITLIYLSYKEAFQITKLYHFIIPFIIVYVAGIFIKRYLLDVLYLNNNLTSNNDFSGQMGRLAYFFSIEGIINFFLGLSAKVYYFLTATIGLGAIGVWGFIKRFFCLLRGKTENKQGYLAIFVVLSFVFSMFLQAFFLIVPVRYDLVIYGRYAEFIYGILIIEGLYQLYINKKAAIRKIPVFFILMIVGGESAICLFQKFNLEFTKSYLAPALYMFFNKKYSLENGVYTSILFTFCTMMMIYLIIPYLYRKRYLEIIITYSVIVFVWAFEMQDINYDIEQDHYFLKNEYMQMVNIIKEDNNNVFALKDKKNNPERILQMQFLIYGSPISYIDYERIIKCDEECLVIIEKVSPYYSFFEDAGDVVCENYRYILVKYYGEKNENNL